MTSTAVPALLVRRATAADASTLRDLARLDSAPALTGPVLLAELDGRPVAALSLETGRHAADPFVPTDALVGLLRAHAEHVAPAHRRARRAPGRRALRLTPA